MNLAKSKVILKKINTLHENIELGEGMSKIEKDLFLDYIKELYEIVLDSKSKKDKKSKHTSLEKEMKAVAPTPKITEVPKVEVMPTPIDNTKVVSAVIDPELEIVKSEPATMSTAQPEPASQASGVHNPAPPRYTSKPAAAPVSSPIKKVDPEIAALFDQTEMDKTSYRFSQTPIADITKAMGINERILTVNLLFNKDQQDFNYVTSKLNYFPTFEEASTYLMNEVADKYEWASGTKRSKAIDFIKLVRRKYNQ